MNLRSILCPTDFSASSDAALRHASSLAKEAGARLIILHVIDESAAYCTEYTGMGYMPDMTQRLEHESQHLLDKIVPTTANVKFDRELVLGSPAKAIIDFANDKSIDLIVMGSHGRTGVTRMLMGSVAEAVVRGASCPVLTVKQPASEDDISTGTANPSQASSTPAKAK